jgi:hypothetical protein
MRDGQPMYSVVHVLSMLRTNIDLKVCSYVSADMNYQNVISREGSSTVLKKKSVKIPK